MKNNSLLVYISLGICFLLVSFQFSCAVPKEDIDIETLIDKLSEVSKLGYGYSDMFSGSQFLPLKGASNVRTLVLGSNRPTESLVLELIVRKGIDAVPALLKHLDDDRKTKIEPVAGMMWISYADEYDYNPRIRDNFPKDVNRDTWDTNEEEDHPPEPHYYCWRPVFRCFGTNPESKLECYAISADRGACSKFSHLFQTSVRGGA